MGGAHVAAALATGCSAVLVGGVAFPTWSDLLPRPTLPCLFGQEPKPVPDAAGLPKLVDGVAQARSWLERSQVRAGHAAQLCRGAPGCGACSCRARADDAGGERLRNP